MGLILLKNICFFFLVISAASFLSTAFAGGRSSFLITKFKLKEENGAKIDQGEIQVYHEEIQERFLRANTKDYGRYDPAPALVKPPFKLIPN